MNALRHGIILLIATLGCAGPSTAVDTSADEAALRQLIVQFDQATAAQDADAVAQQYVENGVRMNAGQPPLVGRDAIRAGTQAAWEQAPVESANEIQEIHVYGDWAMVRGTWTAAITPSDGSEAYEEDGNWVTTFRRQSDGSWLSDWTIWNRNHPPRQ